MASNGGSVLETKTGKKRKKGVTHKRIGREERERVWFSFLNGTTAASQLVHVSNIKRRDLAPLFG